MKNLGRIDLLSPLKLTKEICRLHKKIHDETYFSFDFAVTIDDIAQAVADEDGNVTMGSPLSGIVSLAEEKFDEYWPGMNGVLTNMSFEFRKNNTHGVAIIRATASPLDIIWPPFIK